MPEVSKGVWAAADEIATDGWSGGTRGLANIIERHTHAGEWRTLGLKIVANNFELTPAMRLCLTILLDARDADKEGR